jgi:magnesium-transporting ATPase (P-type)
MYAHALLPQIGKGAMAMFTNVTKVLAALALVAGLFSHSAADHRKLIFLVVWMAALVVLSQAFHRSNYFWAAVFLAVACVFNPFVPIMLPASVGLLSEMAAAILFMISLAVLRSKPRLSIASITAPGAGSESL